MVAGVGDVKVAVGAERHGADAGELAFLDAGRAPAMVERAVGLQFGNAVIITPLGDVEIAGLVANGIADVAEQSRFGARLAADGSEQVAVGRVDTHAVI